MRQKSQGRKSTNKPKISMQERANRLATDSAMEIVWHPGRALSIQIQGSLRSLPSCNSKTMRKRSNRLIPAKSDTQLAALQALRFHYLITTMAQGIQPSFNDKLVSMVVVNSRTNKRAWDSHNVLKFLCDWIEDLGVVTNDNQIEAYCFKAEDYPDQVPDNVTSIILLERSLFRSTGEDVIKKAKRLIQGDGLNL